MVQSPDILHGVAVESAHISTRTVLQVQLDRVTQTVARNHTRLEAEYLRFFDLGELCVQACDHRIGNMFSSFSFIPVFQTDDCHTVGGTLTCQEAVTGYTGVMFYFRGILQDVLYLVQHLAGLFQRTTRSNGYIRHDGSLVFLRDKTCFSIADQPAQQNNGCDQSGPYHPTVMDEKHDAFLVFTQHGVERGIVGGTYTAVNTFGTLIPITRTHHHSTQGRAERQCTNHGKTYGGRHCHTELRIEDTGSTTHESYRHEHGHEHTGTRDNGHRYVAHRIFCSLVGRGVARIEFRLYGFHHHDRVVHHRTDGKHQGEQGQDVDRESGGCQTGECTDQRNDD